MGKKQATTSPVKNSKAKHWLRRFIILVGIFGWFVAGQFFNLAASVYGSVEYGTRSNG